MIFERLELLNFASYYSEHSIDLYCTPEHPVTIVLGGTGQGKTTIFDAINWSLYGADYEITLNNRRGRPIQDYVNETALLDSSRADTAVEMSSTLYFEHEGRHFYIAQRLQAKSVLDNGSIRAEQTDRSTALYEIQSSGNHKAIRYDSLFLDTILPNNVKDYFLFDGDRIYNLSLPGSSKEVRDAIYRVVDLELLSNARDHLQDVATEFRRAAKRESSGDLAGVEDEYEQLREQEQKLQYQLRNLADERVAIDGQINKLEAQLTILPDTSDLQNERTRLASRAQQIEHQLVQLHSELRKNAGTAALSFANEPAKALFDVLDQKRERGEIPKAVSQTLLKDLIKVGRCLCGTEFETGDTTHLALVTRLKAEQSKPNDQTLIDLQMALSKASMLIEDSCKMMRSTDKQVEQLRAEQYELSLAVQQIDDELKKLPKVDVGKLIQEVGQRRNARVLIEGKITRAEEKLSTIDSKIDEVKQKREKLGAKREKYRALQLREKLASLAEQEIDRIYQVFAEEVANLLRNLRLKNLGALSLARLNIRCVLAQTTSWKCLTPTAIGLYNACLWGNPSALAYRL